MLPATGLFQNPRDGQLYVAAGSRTITPTSENHPCDHVSSGETSSNRRPEETHDDLEARALVLEKNGEHAVLVSMDLVGWVVSDVDKVWDRLEALGVDRTHVTISSTHTHTAPDSVGIWGAGDFTTGRCPQYIDFLVETLVDLIVELSENMVPVEVYATETTINVPESNHPNLLSDSRRPYIMNDHFTMARFDDLNGQTVATMLNWHNHPECMITHKVYSADFPRWTRKKIDEELGGTCVYFSGTVGGLMTTLGVDVPERTESGEPVFGRRPAGAGHRRKRSENMELRLHPRGNRSRSTGRCTENGRCLRTGLRVHRNSHGQHRFRHRFRTRHPRTLIRRDDHGQRRVLRFRRLFSLYNSIC